MLLRLLVGQDSGALEAKILHDFGGEFAHEPLKRQLADEQVGGLLVAANLAEGDYPGTIAVRPLDTTHSGGGLAGCFGGELMSGGHAAGRLPCGLLGPCHFQFYGNRRSLGGLGEPVRV